MGINLLTWRKPLKTMRNTDLYRILCSELGVTVLPAELDAKTVAGVRLAFLDTIENEDCVAIWSVFLLACGRTAIAELYSQIVE
jgi:hypothetical protein